MYKYIYITYIYIFIYLYVCSLLAQLHCRKANVHNKSARFLSLCLCFYLAVVGFQQVGCLGGYWLTALFGSISMKTKRSIQVFLWAGTHCKRINSEINTNKRNWQSLAATIPSSICVILLPWLLQSKDIQNPPIAIPSSNRCGHGPWLLLPYQNNGLY